MFVTTPRGDVPLQTRENDHRRMGGPRRVDRGKIRIGLPLQIVIGMVRDGDHVTPERRRLVDHLRHRR
jgi:hypothetical protein